MTGRLGFWLAHLFVLSYCGVLLAGFAVQFGGDELPCPLCLLQRQAMILVMCGPLYIIARTRRGDVTLADYTTGYGMSIVAAVVGAAVAARQILLHIAPPDPGYGSTVLGLHLYTWSFITFCVVLVFCGVSLIFGRELVPRGVRFGWPSKVVCGLFLVIVAANLVAAFFELGFHWFLPPDPTRYETFPGLPLLGAAMPGGAAG
ncbi:disulfide bond formation protein B [Salinispora cortesiana]|uniref:disulfide bond formation protein B n=1 Tax=Salinispora cortesiana TaxID=1305843 RepID=UPI0004124101|nr:disulfide bond formation protein B [Salinispora cortesiana]